MSDNIQNKDTFGEIESALTKAEQFIEDNKLKLMYIIGGILVAVLLVIGAKRFIFDKQEKEAAGQMFTAIKYFEKDSFKIALEGDGMNYGFLDVMDEYGITSSANLASYYAGICYLKMGQFEESIDYLNKFRTKDPVLKPLKYGNIGNAYVELKNFEEGLKFYIKAAKTDKNGFTTPLFLLKAGIISEKLSDYENALKFYTEIKENYPQSTEAANIDKYITSLKAIL